MSLTKRWLDEMEENGECICIRNKDNVCEPCNPNCAACIAELKDAA